MSETLFNASYAFRLMIMKEYKRPNEDQSAAQDLAALKTQNKLEQEAANIEDQAQKLLQQEPKIDQSETRSGKSSKGPDQTIQPQNLLATVSSSKGSKGAYIAVFAALLIVAAIAYAFFELNTKITALETFKADTQSQESRFESSELALQKAFDVLEEKSLKLDTLANANRDLNLENQKLKARLGELENKVSSSDARISSISSDLKRFKSRHPDDWLIAQSFFLVSSANSMAVYSDDMEAALWNLKNADSLLVNIDNEAIISIRKNLQEDILYLSGLPKTDIRGINFKIDSLLESIPQLPLSETVKENQALSELKEAQEPNSSFANWKENLLNSVKSFSSKFIEIRRRSDPEVNRFLSFEQSGILIHNLRSLLLMSKFAILEHDKPSFDRNILQVKNLLETYFDHSDPKYAAALNLLDEISLSNFSTQRPAVLKSFSAFKKFAREQLRLYDSESKANASSATKQEIDHD